MSPRQRGARPKDTLLATVAVDGWADAGVAIAPGTGHRAAFNHNPPSMRYGVVVEAVDEVEGMPGVYYAHVPTLNLTTHGHGIDGALSSARDLIEIWTAEKRAAGEPVPQPKETLLTVPRRSLPR